MRLLVRLGGLSVKRDALVAALDEQAPDVMPSMIARWERFPNPRTSWGGSGDLWSGCR